MPPTPWSPMPKTYPLVCLFQIKSTRPIESYLFTISNDNVVNVLRITPLGQIVLNPVLVEDIQKAAFWFLKTFEKS